MVLSETIVSHMYAQQPKDTDQYLIGTGAAVCVAPLSYCSGIPFEESTKTYTINIVSADGSSIPVHGWKRVPLSIGGSATTTDFLISDVVSPILGVHALNQVEIGFHMTRGGGYLYRGNDKVPINIISSLPYCHLKRFVGPKSVCAVDHKDSWILGETTIERRHRCSRLAFFVPTHQTMRDCPVTIDKFGSKRVSNGKYVDTQKMLRLSMTVGELCIRSSKTSQFGQDLRSLI